MSIQILDFKRRFQRGLSNPFESFGMEWCSRCKMEVDCDTQASHRDTLYVYKRWCLRCGKVIKSGVYDHVPIFTPSKNMKLGIEFVTTPEMDRRGRVKRHDG